MAGYMNVESKKKGEFDGDVSQKHHAKWIELKDLKLPTERPGVNTSPGNVTNRTTSAVDFTDVEISKYMDAASPALMTWNIDGATHDVDLELCRENGVCVLHIKLYAVILTNYETTCDEEGTVEETIALDYTKIDMDFTTFDKNNEPQSGKGKSCTYDLEQAARV